MKFAYEVWIAAYENFASHIYPCVYVLYILGNLNTAQI